MLGIAALGVVFGDIGTSPLYAMQATFSPSGGNVPVTAEHVAGIISVVIWSITLIVTLKYVMLVLRADHHGEGGILSLATLVRRHVSARGRLASIAMVAGIIGACLFFGDSVITPAISVLSAVEGLRVADPELPDVIVPIALVILISLFLVQRWGTAVIGRWFGPIMLCWFVLLAVLGMPHIVAHPQILVALSPHHAIAFIVSEPLVAMIALGSVVLSVTGAEALYADLGHFGRKPIQFAWLVVVYPSLIINYLGQGALILTDPSAVENPFFRMAPEWATVALVVIATGATIIASQSVISGAYSVAMQAMRLGLLPRLEIRHTSRRERGQVYLPAVNTILMVLVIVVVLLFRESSALASAYGLAVTSTFVVTTLLVLVVLHRRWSWPLPAVITVGVVLLAVESSYLVANSLKFLSGGWLPIVIGAALFIVMNTWSRGRAVVTEHRNSREGRLDEYFAYLRDNPPRRVAGTAIYPHASPRTVPLALRLNIKFNKVLHERVVFVRVITLEEAHVPAERRIQVDDVSGAPEGVSRMTITLGFFDRVKLPAMMAEAAPRLDLSPKQLDDAVYVLTHMKIQALHARGIAKFRRALFVALSRSAASPSDHYGLPGERTIELSATITV